MIECLKKALNSFGFVGSGYSRKTEIFESGIYEIDYVRVCYKLSQVLDIQEKPKSLYQESMKWTPSEYVLTNTNYVHCA